MNLDQSLVLKINMNKYLKLVLLAFRIFFLTQEHVDTLSTCITQRQKSMSGLTQEEKICSY